MSAQVHAAPFPMKNITIFLVRRPAAFQEAAGKAARAAFPDADIVAAQTVEDAARRPAAQLQLLVLAGADEGEVAMAAQATDAGKLPRWAVVILGGGSSELLDSVPPEECNERLLARVFRSAVLQHELVCENLQLRGDLKTVARRIRHDLFTPLNCIHITCESLFDLPAGNAPAHKTKVVAIQDMLSETCRLIDRVSFILRASAEGAIPEVVSMDAVVANALDQLGLQIRKVRELHGAAACELARREWAWRRGWRLSGGISSPTRSGTGRSSAPIRLGWSEQGDVVRFWVSDQGAGVPVAEQSRLFQRFDRLHTATAPGLGLAFVQRLMALQGGDCGYERRDDNASLFYFTLPAAVAPLSPATPG